MKSYRLIVDPADIRRAWFCFLKATQIYRRIWRAVTYQNAAIVTEAELILGRERVQRLSLQA